MKYAFLLCFGTFLWQTTARNVDGTSMDVYNQCTVISEPVCQDIRYTHTRMPNLIGINSQNEASKRIRDYYPLINLQCSHYLKLFLCSMYFPICDAESQTSPPVVRPCQRLCLHVKARCEPFMKDKYRILWPDELDCDKLPIAGKMCLAPESFVLDKETSTESTHPNIMKELQQQLQSLVRPGGRNGASLDIAKIERSLSETKCLPSQLNLGLHTNLSCVHRCDADIKFNGGDKAFANVWLIGWSLLCLLSSLFTIVTFSCNTNRFLYPEKPIVFLSICYFFQSCGNLLGAVLGRRNIICRPYNDQYDFLVSNGNEMTWCKIIFLMLYYFSTASALWWVVLTVTWFLSASRHWGFEAIESLSSVFHLICWGTPSLKSICILILHKVDPDELTGLCFVGNNHLPSLLGFVLVPQIVYLMAGITFLSLGYISILKVRKSFLRQPSCIDTNNLKRLEKLMAKIGIFSILYIVPVTCSIASYVVDALKSWHFELALKILYKYSPDCVIARGLSWSLAKCVNLIQPALPSAEMRMLRIFMNLVIGITSGIWIWGNKKTFRQCCCFFKNFNSGKGIQMIEMKETESQKAGNNTFYLKPADGNLQSQNWTYCPSVLSEPTVCGIVNEPCEGIVAPNNSSKSETSSRH